MLKVLFFKHSTAKYPTEKKDDNYANWFCVSWLMFLLMAAFEDD